MIEQHRDLRSEGFLGGVSINTASAAVPTHDHAIGCNPDDCVARNIDDALQAREFVFDARELFVSTLPGSPDYRTGNYLDEEQDDDKTGEISDEADNECAGYDEGRDGPQVAADVGDGRVAVEKHGNGVEAGDWDSPPVLSKSLVRALAHEELSHSRAIYFLVGKFGMTMLEQSV